jgi:hypothetical protein
LTNFNLVVVLFFSQGEVREETDRNCSVALLPERLSCRMPDLL